jgi:hypothetical protein
MAQFNVLTVLKMVAEPVLVAIVTVAMIVAYVNVAFVAIKIGK